MIIDDHWWFDYSIFIGGLIIPNKWKHKKKHIPNISKPPTRFQ